MDNKEISKLLRSLADVYESDINDDSKKVIFNEIMKKVNQEGETSDKRTITNPLFDSPVTITTNSFNEGAYQFTDGDVKRGYHVKLFFTYFCIVQLPRIW